SELITAVRDGWFVPGSSIMDIGSGRGHISAALARRGFTVLGADLVESATQLARRHFSRIGPNLTFRTLDICMDLPEAGRFDAFLDRGCFHGLSQHASLQQKYLENVFAWGKPGARLLLFHAVGQEGQSDAPLAARRMLEADIRRLFEPWFEISK